jgi:hypothetical protein
MKLIQQFGLLFMAASTLVSCKKDITELDGNNVPFNETRFCDR